MNSTPDPSRSLWTHRAAQELVVILEPWGFEIPVERDATITVNWIAGRLEDVEMGSSKIVLFGSPGSLLMVDVDGRAVLDGRSWPPVPPIGEGKTMRAWLSALFSKRPRGD